jgi:hypothetical protein
MSIIQVMAAKMAGVDILYYHTYDNKNSKHFEIGMKILNDKIESKDDFSVSDIILFLEKEEFKWGVSDGN